MGWCQYRFPSTTTIHQQNLNPSFRSFFFMLYLYRTIADSAILHFQTLLKQ
jgi:hypothetical protein